MFVSDEERLLADVFADALTGWDSLKAEDGSTAADLAEQSGAEGINAMIQRKLAGKPSGIRAQHFDFDPDTGEWIDQDDTSGIHSESQTKDLLPVTDRSDDSASLMIPVIPQNTTALTPHEAITRHGVPRLIEVGVADNWLAMSLPSSGAEEHHTSEDCVEVLNIGLRQRGEGQSQGACGDNDSVSLKYKGYEKRVEPCMFDAQAALFSSAVVGAVVVCALGLRFCFEWCEI